MGIAGARPKRITISGLRPGRPTSAARSARSPGTSTGWLMWAVFQPPMRAPAREPLATLPPGCTQCSGRPSRRHRPTGDPRGCSIWRAVFRVLACVVNTRSEADAASSQSLQCGVAAGRAVKPVACGHRGIGLKRSQCLSRPKRRLPPSSWPYLARNDQHQRSWSIWRPGSVIEDLDRRRARPQLLPARRSSLQGLTCAWPSKSPIRCGGLPDSGMASNTGRHQSPVPVPKS